MVQKHTSKYTALNSKGTSLSKPNSGVNSPNFFIKSVFITILCRYCDTTQYFVFVFFQLVCAISYSSIYYAVFYMMIKNKDLEETFVFQTVGDFFPRILPDKVSLLDGWKLSPLSFFVNGQFKSFQNWGVSLKTKLCLGVLRKIKTVGNNYLNIQWI